MTNYICILDFEMTCWENSVENKKKKNMNEIIEFPSVMLKWNSDNSDHIIINDNTKTNDNTKIIAISQFQQFVKPIINPKISDYCTKLTGITQEQVDNGVVIKLATKMHMNWLQNFTTSELTIVICGGRDLSVLAANLNIVNFKLNKLYTRFVNIKNLFQKIIGAKAYNMAFMLDYLKLKLDGRHHSGIDDCANISKIFIELVNRGLTKDMFLQYVEYI